MYGIIDLFHLWQGRDELKAHQWPENTIKKLINCVSCGEPNRIMVTYADDAVASTFADQDVWFELDNGKCYHA